MTSSARLSVEAAARIGKVANIGNLQLFRLLASIEQEPQGQGDLTWNLKDPEFFWNRDGVALVALLPLELTLNFQTTDTATPQPLGVIQVGYKLDFVLKEDLETDEDIPDFVGITGFLQVWPYLRAEVQSLTAKLGLPSLTLPVLLSGQAASIVTVKHVREATNETK